LVVISLPSLHDHIQTHHSRWDSSGRVISLTQRPCETTHNIHNSAPGGIRTLNPSKLAATDPLLRPRDHRDLPNFTWW